MSTLLCATPKVTTVPQIYPRYFGFVFAHRGASRHARWKGSASAWDGEVSERSCHYLQLPDLHSCVRNKPSRLVSATMSSSVSAHNFADLPNDSWSGLTYCARLKISRRPSTHLPLAACGRQVAVRTCDQSSALHQAFRKYTKLCDFVTAHSYVNCTNFDVQGGKGQEPRAPFPSHGGVRLPAL